MIKALIKRDYLIEKSYRFNFFLRFSNILFFSVIFFYVSRMINLSGRELPGIYGNDYFSFVIFGLAFSRYLGAAITSFTHFIQNEQQLGTVGAIFMAPHSGAKIILFSSIWQFIYATFEVMLYLFLGAVVFGVQLDYGMLPAAAAVTILTIISLSGIGLFSAGMIILFKRGDPVNWLFAGISEVLCGVYFPVELLPQFLRSISAFLPLTYSLSAVRSIMLGGAGFNAVAADIAVLLIFSAILFPVGLIFLNYAIKKAKTKGTLETY